VSNTKGKYIFHYQLSPESFGYTLIYVIDNLAKPAFFTVTMI